MGSYSRHCKPFTEICRYPAPITLPTDLIKGFPTQRLNPWSLRSLRSLSKGKPCGNLRRIARARFPCSPNGEAQFVSLPLPLPRQSPFQPFGFSRSLNVLSCPPLLLSYA